MSDLSDYESEEQYARMIEESLRTVSEEAASSYLGTYGDAVQERIDQCLKAADDLDAHGLHPSAVVAAASAIELTIRYLLVRPLVQGAFLSEEWAAVLTSRVANGRTAEDRDLLPAVLRQWGVDITKLRIANGEALWEAALPAIWRRRNLVVHQGSNATAEDSVRAREASRTLLKQAVAPVATRLGFTVETTGKWGEIREESGTLEDGTYRSRSRTFSRRSPFDNA